MIRTTFFLSLLFLCSGLMATHLEVVSYLGDHMVVQQNSRIKVKGWGEPYWEVWVTNSWSRDTLRTAVRFDAGWELTMKTPAAGGPYSFTVHSGKERIEIVDVLSGELWLCSGQSNMAWSAMRGIRQMQEEVKTKVSNQIRLFQVEKRFTPYLKENISGSWQLCDASSLSEFSAIGYFFGKRLYQETGLPVGLINSSWGGTPVEIWTPREVFQQHPELEKSTEEFRQQKGWRSCFCQGYNAMIYPLSGLDLAGVIWYQGESNIENCEVYAQTFTEMIKSWRKLFGKELPFYYVQLAPFSGASIPLATARVREQQDRTLALPGTGMVVITDLVDNVKDIHPQEKREVGNRLAGLALKEVYGRKDLNPYSPRVENIEVKGNKVTVSFSNTNKLVVKGMECTGFELAGADKKFVPAMAKVKGARLILNAGEVIDPQFVRFSFSDAGISNLFGDNGLPVAPFRTDKD